MFYFWHDSTCNYQRPCELIGDRVRNNYCVAYVTSASLRDNPRCHANVTTETQTCTYPSLCVSFSDPIFTSLDFVRATLSMSNSLFVSRLILTFAPFHLRLRSQRLYTGPESARRIVGNVAVADSHYGAVHAIFFVDSSSIFTLTKIFKYFLFRHNETNCSFGDSSGRTMQIRQRPSVPRTYLCGEMR